MTTNENLPQRIAGGTTTVRDVNKIQAIILSFFIAGCLIGGAIALFIK